MRIVNASMTIVICAYLCDCLAEKWGVKQFISLSVRIMRRKCILSIVNYRFHISGLKAMNNDFFLVDYLSLSLTITHTDSFNSHFYMSHNFSLPSQKWRGFFSLHKNLIQCPTLNGFMQNEPQYSFDWIKIMIRFSFVHSSFVFVIYG